MRIRRPTRRAAGTLLLVLGGAALLALPGCVERKLVIKTDTPGAVVFLEDEQVPGETNVEVPFEWDGERRVRIQAPGHRVLETTAVVEPRWYDWFPLDVFAQFLYPGTISDVREFSYKLEAYSTAKATPAQLAEDRERLDALKERAETYRAGGSEGPGNAAVAAQPAAPPPTQTPPDVPPPPLGPKSAAPPKPGTQTAPATEPPPATPPAPPVAPTPRPKPPAPPPPEQDQEPQKPPKPGDPLPPPKKPGR